MNEIENIFCDHLPGDNNWDIFHFHAHTKFIYFNLFYLLFRLTTFHFDLAYTFYIPYILSYSICMENMFIVSQLVTNLLLLDWVFVLVIVVNCEYQSMTIAIRLEIFTYLYYISSIVMQDFFGMNLLSFHGLANVLIGME